MYRFIMVAAIALAGCSGAPAAQSQGPTDEAPSSGDLALPANGTGTSGPCGGPASTTQVFNVDQHQLVLNVPALCDDSWVDPADPFAARTKSAGPVTEEPSPAYGR